MGFDPRQRRVDEMGDHERIAAQQLTDPIADMVTPVVRCHVLAACPMHQMPECDAAQRCLYADVTVPRGSS